MTPSLIENWISSLTIIYCMSFPITAEVYINPRVM